MRGLSEQRYSSSRRRTLRALGAIATLVNAPTARLSPARARRVPRTSVGVWQLSAASPPRRRGVGVGAFLFGGGTVGAAPWSVCPWRPANSRTGAYTATRAVSRCRNRLGPETGAALTAPTAAGSDPDTAESDDGDGSPSASVPRGDGLSPRSPHPTQHVESLPLPLQSPSRPQGPPLAVPHQPLSTSAAGVASAPGAAGNVPPVDAWLVAPDTAPKRVADTRRQPMRLSALFEEFSQYLRVEREAAPRTVET